MQWVKNLQKRLKKVNNLENSIPDATTFTHKNQNNVDTESISLGERNWWCSQQNARY